MPRSLPAGLLALLVLVAGAGATAASPSEVPAAARTTVQLLEAGLTHADGSGTHAGLGQARLVATRDGEPFASLDLVGGSVADQRIAEWNATTDGSGERSGEVSPELSAAGGVDAALHLGDYLVRALGTEATSSVSAIQGALGLAPLDLRVDNIGPALTTSVTDVSTSTTSLTLGAIELTLGDLLPPGLTQQLPLGVVIDLLARLPVTVPTVQDLVTLVETLLDDLVAVADAQAAVDGVRTELHQLVSDAPGVAAAEDAVATAEDAAAEATAALDQALADRESARSALAAAEAALERALADADAGDTTDDVTDTVDDTTDGTTDEVTDGVDDTTEDITDAVDDTTDDVTDAVGDTIGGLGGTSEVAGDPGSAITTAGAADALVEEAERLVADATAALAETGEAVAAARAVADDAEAALAEAVAELDDLVDQATGSLGDTATELREELTRRRGEVTELLDQVSSHARAVPDLGVLLDDLRDGLAAVPLVSLGGVSFDVALRADAGGATAKVDCRLEVITVFGQTLEAPTCSEASDLLGTVPGELIALIDALPIEQLPLPRIAGLAVTTDATAAPEDGVTCATATATGLALEVPQVSLTGTADELTRRLDGLLGDALAAARSVADTATAASTTKAFTPTTVLRTLGDLRDQLDGLPVGGQLDGLRTLGVDVTVGHLAAEVLHGATADGPLALASPFDDPTAPAPGPDGAPDPGDGGAPGAPPDGPPSLPATGGGVGLLALAMLGAALLLGRWGG